jgi:hypothetical protein
MRQAALAGPGEKTLTFRCACPAGRQFRHLDPAPPLDFDLLEGAV